MPEPFLFASTSSSYTNIKMSLPWPSIPNPIPRRYRRRLRSKFRSSISPTTNITSIETSYNPVDTIRELRAHKWSVYDAKYLLLVIITVFSLSVSQAPGPIVKTGAASLLILALLVPVSRQFFLPALPILTWVFFFFNARFIPAEYRPHIWVKVLPALENILYGANLSKILSAHQHSILDLLAWIPYGILHFGGPFVWAALMFICAPPGTVPVFAQTFGYLNIAGVVIQLIFPCSPPWYENMYGLAPANYSIEGSPAGLRRIDELFGVDLYTSSFTASPLVFGAFPSLHSGNAVLEAFFMSHCFPKLRPLFILYAMWMWWATMYLSHHYAVDLVGGGLLAAIAFYVAKSNFLPRVQPGKVLRWEYDYVERGDFTEGKFVYDLQVLDCGSDQESGDKWTVGTSSSVSSGSRSPVDDNASSWESETLASQTSDTDLSEVVW
ncbi:Inositol phosphorylceramide synthase catalytic subunit aur1 [Golovinomyces cichoracearum]|uniref:Inositol phosphorylceramide synthase catalytic subunit aur1 n=1 Tax=Golovinomyces cichoracearum TaxID=62708 RepID=A0A420IAR2_9PEZI|nr:Inositol phosphorylceramide synthase catalytic subunit aur1 [Golovinomyces cichoracearum]